MVFGWNKKKPVDQKHAEVSRDIKINFSDIPKILNEIRELRHSQTISKIKDIRNTTQPLIDELANIGNLLEKDDLKVDDIDRHLAIIIVRGKKQVINVIKKDVVALPTISSIEDTQKLRFSLNQILKKTGDVLGRQTKVIHIFAKKYATQLKENLEVMSNNHLEVCRVLDSFDNTNSDLQNIEDTIKRIHDLRKSKETLLQKITKTKQDSKKTTELISTLQHSINDVKSSADYKKYLELKENLNDFGSQKLNIKNQIDAQFTKISRPLSRYKYGSSLDKDQKNIFSELVSDPFKVLLPENLDPIILILENVKKGISSGHISVKDVEKTLSHITETEESLDGFVSQISEYFKKQKILQDDMDSLLPKNLNSLEHDLVKNTSLENDLATKLDNFAAEITDADVLIPQLYSDVESKLRSFSNIKYSLES